MRAHSGSSSLHVVERNGPGGRLVLQQAVPEGRRLLVVTGYAGPELPHALTAAACAPAPGGAAGQGNWRLEAAEGRFDFRARAVQQVDERPALYGHLHRSFALSATDRLAVRLLLWLLRLPGGARLLRRWHRSRSA